MKRRGYITCYECGQRISKGVCKGLWRFITREKYEKAKKYKRSIVGQKVAVCSKCYDLLTGKIIDYKGGFLRGNPEDRFQPMEDE